jgi:GH35 family endo-1,4-beta-xylanase
VAGNCGGVIIVSNKTAEEKEFIVNSELEKWIFGVVSNSKDVVKAWNVVNEPMDDANPTQVKTGVGVAASATQFFWQDYLGGKDYGIKAFNLAKQNANSTDLLFISDYGLESNLNKCNGLIQYVGYLESKGAKVNGIAARMNLNINSDRDKISTMFELLAATGKKIAITDLYVNALTTTPTAEIHQLQADMYRYVVEIYAQKVPVAQRYGITVKGIQDNSADAQGLWNSAFSRKPAYGGFAEGLKSLK